MTRVISGDMQTMSLPVYNCVFIRSMLASSKRFFSKSSLEKARITDTPVRISRDTRFILSTSFCIILNFGMDNLIRMNTSAIIVTTATTISQFRPVSVVEIMMIPPIARIGE